MQERRPMDGLASGMMLVLCLVWAMQQIVIKATATEFAPVLQIGVRGVVGAVLLVIFMLARGIWSFEFVRYWRPGLVAAALYALEFVLVGESLRFTTAGHVVVLLYTAPIFAALGLHWKLPEERLALVQWGGVVLAFAGVALAFLWRDAAPGSQGANMLFGDLLALLGGAAWGATTVVVRVTRLSTLPASHMLMYQLAAGAVFLLLAAFMLGQTYYEMTPAVWGSLIFQSIFVAFLSYLAWFWLLRKYLASRLGVFSFLTPLFGVLLGAWLLGEPVGAGFLGGTLLVVLGVVILSGYGWLKQLFSKLGR